MPSYIRYSNRGNVDSYMGTSEYEPNWEDERSPATLGKQGQTNKPDFDFTNLGLLMPQNDATEIVYVSNQLPHGTATKRFDKALRSFVYEIWVYPHIHYFQDEADIPVFKIDYRFYNNGTAPPSFTTGLSTTDGDGLVFPYVSGTLLQIIPFPPILITAPEPSMWYDVKVYRDDNVVTGDVLYKGFDFHRPVDTLGSEGAYIK